MTVLDVKTQILLFLQNHDGFLESDFDELVQFNKKDNKNFKKSLVKKAIKEMIKENIISEHPGNSNSTSQWRLNRPLSLVSSPVDISLETKILISNVIDKYAENSGLEIKSHIYNIQERDIQLLCVCLSSLIDFVVDLDNGDQDDRDDNPSSDNNNSLEDNDNNDMISQEEINKIMNDVNLDDQKDGDVNS